MYKPWANAGISNGRVKYSNQVCVDFFGEPPGFTPLEKLNCAICSNSWRIVSLISAFKSLYASGNLLGLYFIYICIVSLSASPSTIKGNANKSSLGINLNSKSYSMGS